MCLFSAQIEITAIYILFPGKVELNPPKPPVNVQPVDVGPFTRTVTGESFLMEANAPPNFPPNKITDLTAEIQMGTVFLNWTAPGEDYDQGTGESCASLYWDRTESLILHSSFTLCQ